MGEVEVYSTPFVFLTDTFSGKLESTTRNRCSSCRVF